MKGGPQGRFSLFHNTAGIAACRLYKRLGFRRLGVIPNGFRMKDSSYANICPYYISLVFVPEDQS